MGDFDKLIYSILSTNRYDFLIYERYACIDALEIQGKGLSELFDMVKGDWGSNPPAFLKHDHIPEHQRAFSILLRPGNNLYAIRLDPKIDCQFGDMSSPIRLFSEHFFNEFVTDVALHNSNGDTITDFMNPDNDLSVLEDFHTVTFRVNLVPPAHDPEPPIGGNTVSNAILSSDGDGGDDHDGDHDHDHDHDADFTLALPFHFNLYDSKLKVPIWVADAFSSDPGYKNLKWHGKVHPSLKAFWHGKVHPKANMVWHGKVHPNVNGFLIFE